MPTVLISADLEGVSTIVHPSETNPEQYDYDRGRALMAGDVNAVIAGVLEAEPSVSVVVADSHGSFRNLLPEDLDQRARLIRGRPRSRGMVEGLGADVAAVLFVGYHARAGAGPAVLAHTISDAVLSMRLNGREMGEIGLNAVLAGHFDIPVVLLSGDEAAAVVDERPLPPQLALFHLLIDRDHQRRGYGRAAVQSLINLAVRVDQCERLRLTVHPHNHSAIRLYRSEGFVDDGADAHGELRMSIGWV